MFKLSSAIKQYTEAQDKVLDPDTTVKNALERLNKTYDLSNVKIEPGYNAVEGAYACVSLSDQMAASGKGLTPEQSRASAIMEFCERYSWLHFDYKNYNGYTLKSFNEIKKGDTATVDESYFLRNFINLDDRKTINEEIKNIPLKWIKGFSLTRERDFYYPINWHNMLFTANGMASGNTIEEAILQAVCEVIERENIYRLFVEKKIPNDVDLKSITNPLITKVLEGVRKSGIQLTIKDISFDFKIPTFIAYGVYPPDKGKLTYQGEGQGANPDTDKALIRALSEYLEGFSVMQKAQKDLNLNMEEILPSLPIRHFGFFNLYNPEMLLKKKRLITLNRIRSLSKQDIRDEIEEIVKILKKHGYEVVFVDKTNPQLNIPAVRIFVPGMRNVLGTALTEPWFVMSEVHHEAGNSEAAVRNFKKTSEAKQFNFILGSITKSSQFFKEDYLVNIGDIVDFKKNAPAALKQFDQS